MAASHIGSPAHVERVSAILARIGLDGRDLACGIHDPSDPVSLDHVRRHPEAASPLYNNCSGKHAGMLALALAEGWPTHGYQQADHPVQQLMRRTVAEVSGLEPEAVGIAVDGCSVSVFILPLARMARAWARLAVARPAGDARERALHRIRSAMLKHPRATSGAGQLSADLMEATGGRVVAKGGAEGLQCLGLPEHGVGIALKCEDGAGRAVGPATTALLEQIGVLSEAERNALAGWRRTVVRNHAGLEVGFVSAEIRVSEGVEASR
jgi:L-asparaginase II